MTDELEIDVRIRQLVAEMVDIAPDAPVFRGDAAGAQRSGPPSRGPAVAWLGAAAAVLLVVAGLAWVGRSTDGQERVGSTMVASPTATTEASAPSTDGPALGVSARVVDGSGAALFALDDATHGDVVARWVQSQVRSELLAMEELGATVEARQRRLSEDGLVVRLSLDPRVQTIAQRALSRMVPAGLQAMVVTLDHRTGAIVAVAGQGEADPARPLSAPPARLATYAAAIEAGYGLDDSVDGTGPCEVAVGDATYSATNFGGSSGSVGSLLSMVTSSSTCAQLRLQAELGPARVRALIEDMTGAASSGGPPAVDVPVLTAVEVASMYSVVPAAGIRRAPTLVDEVTDAGGEVLWARPAGGDFVVAESTAALLDELLVADVRTGTGIDAGRGFDPGAVSGLTGTSEVGEVAWFAGSTGTSTTALWVAFPGGQPMVDIAGVALVTGGSIPADAWAYYMANIDEPPESVDATPIHDPVPTPAD